MGCYSAIGLEQTRYDERNAFSRWYPHRISENNEDKPGLLGQKQVKIRNPANNFSYDYQQKFLEQRTQEYLKANSISYHCARFEESLDINFPKTLLPIITAH